MKEIYFIRHGESSANSLNICAGHIDVPLTDAGLEQARQAGRELAMSKRSIDLIISSPLQRALVTAIEIANIIGYPEGDILVQQDAMEQFRGDLEGRPSSAQDGLTDADYIRHGAESEANMILRAKRLLDFINSRPEDSCLVVSHNQFGRTLVAYSKGIDRKDINKLPNAHAFLLDTSGIH